MIQWMSVSLVLVGVAVAACSGTSTGTTSGGLGDAGSDSGTSDGGGGTIVDPTTFDRTCTKDADCVGVITGNACLVCQCPNDAIAASQQASYTAEFAAARNKCGPLPAIACVSCPPTHVSCSAAGKCTIGASVADGGTDGG